MSKNILIELMKAMGEPLTLENFQRLRYMGEVPKEIGAEDEADTPEEFLVCDFCSGGPVVSRYHANGFVSASLPLWVHGSVDDWSSCPCCTPMIDSANRDGLLAHSVVSFFEANPECSLPVEFVRQHLIEMYEKMRASGFRKALNL
jgi:hypothetical protein